MAEIFRRIEKKYILSKEQFEKVTELMKRYVNPDEYGKSIICNIYFDSDDYRLISHSIQKPYQKDKIRLRSYDIPNRDSKVFLEVKRKADNVVGKRRIAMKLSDYEKYLEDKNAIEIKNKQIKKELDYYFSFYNLKEKMYIAYDREAYYAKDNKDFRITFDTNIRARNYELDLSKGAYGQDILGENKYIMEIKTLNSIPLWFVKIIEECNIVPGSFSKYGAAYEQIVLNGKNELIAARASELAYAIA